jgi:ABC transport system ATP-binding/permease protein
MNIISMEDISKSFSHKPLLENISFGMTENEKVGLLGINGSGKSTFLKIITGHLSPDSGKITKRGALRIGYLSQSIESRKDMDVLEYVFNSDDVLMRTIRQYNSVTVALQDDPGNKELGKELASLTSRMDVLDAWNIEAQAKAVLDRLNIKDHRQKISTLSGGQLKRAALAQTLIQPSDLLILDEPTNHIDLEAVRWLEGYISSMKGALLLVTHDRYFLSRLVTRIIEIDKGSLYSYEGNFEGFLEKKAERQQARAAIEQKRRRLYLNELAWMRRGAKARTTKQKARIARFEKLRDSKTEVEEQRLEIPTAYRRLGNKAIELYSVTKSYGDMKIVDGLSHIIKPGERIGLVGPNGSGKTTLLNLISGSLAPDKGSIDIGETVKISYYRQDSEDMDPATRAIDYIRETAEYFETRQGRTVSASQMLEQFLFDDATQYSYLKDLSGGEKRRLMLTRVLMERPNVLLLDEPTNDLDIQTLEALEEYLEYFNGVVIAASHDRYFLEKTTERLIALEGEGRTSFYNDLLSYEKSLGQAKPDKAPKALQEHPSEKKKFSYREKIEYEQIEEELGWKGLKQPGRCRKTGQIMRDYQNSA